MSFARIVVALIAVFCLATGTFVDHGKDAYLHGDYKKALDDWQALALQNNAQAEFGLGLLYEHGYGVTRSYEAAAAWYQKAAEQGDSSPQDNLGLLYLLGHGVSQNDAKAAMWFS